MGLFRRRKSAPARATAGAAAPQPRADVEEVWREGVEEHGWLVFDIPADEPDGDGDGAPGFSFTTGLTERGLPEMLVYGLPENAGMNILNDLAARLISGERFSDGQPVEGLVHGDYRLQLWDTTWLQDPLGAAFRLYGEANVKVRQLVVPDRQHRLPWEAEYETPYLQPLLFTGPNGVGPRWSGGGHVRGEHSVPDDWDLPLDPHVAVLTTRYIADDALAALLVVHEHGGGWQVLDGLHEPVEEIAVVICLHHLVVADPTLTDVFRTLRPGHEAARGRRGGPWQVREYEGEQ